MISIVDQDEYGTVYNSERTFVGLSAVLRVTGKVIFAWTEQEGTHLDILMVKNPVQLGALQRGMNTMTDLFVAVSGIGMFGFELNGREKYPGYVGEKLKMDGGDVTTEKLADLINGIQKELLKDGE